MHNGQQNHDSFHQPNILWVRVETRAAWRLEVYLTLH